MLLESECAQSSCTSRGNKGGALLHTQRLPRVMCCENQTITHLAIRQRVSYLPQHPARRTSPLLQRCPWIDLVLPFAGGGRDREMRHSAVVSVSMTLLLRTATGFLQPLRGACVPAIRRCQQSYALRARFLSMVSVEAKGQADTEAYRVFFKVGVGRARPASVPTPGDGSAEGVWGVLYHRKMGRTSPPGTTSP
jgi:hypothetical protein